MNTDLSSLGAELEALLTIIGATKAWPAGETTIHLKASFECRTAGVTLPLSALNPLLRARYEELRTAIEEELAR